MNVPYYPNLGAAGTATDVGGKISLDVYVSGGSLSFTEDATVADGGALPAKVKVVGGYDGANVRAIKTNASGEPAVNVQSSALPTGAATAAKQDTQSTTLSSILASLADVATASNQDAANIDLDAINTKTPALVSGRVPVDGSGVTQPVSAASLPLPTGAATESTLAAQSAKLPASLGAKLTADSFSVTLASDHGALPLPTGAATEATLSAQSAKLPASLGAKTSANSFSVVMASDQAAIPTKDAVNSGGSGSAAAATVSTVATLTAPANAVGFILMNLDTSTTNLRWAVGRTASATLGQQLQPGRDTGYIPAGANVSVCAESGTCNVDIQWVSQ